MSENQNESKRLIILICYDCKKMIGTRENYHTERRLVMRFNKPHYITVAICDGCSNDK